MASLSTTFNPAQVALKGGPGPYLWGGSGTDPGKKKGGPIMWSGPSSGGTPTYNGSPTQVTVPATAAPAPPSNILSPESIRATGTGPFDAAYRQNLATYAGGQFSRPGGSMNFNPTDPSTFPGQPTGGGTAPVAGMPTSLMDMALGGQSFGWTPPAPAATDTAPGQFQSLQDWMNQFMMNGRKGRMGSIV